MTVETCPRCHKTFDIGRGHLCRDLNLISGMSPGWRRDQFLGRAYARRPHIAFIGADYQRREIEK